MKRLRSLFWNTVAKFGFWIPTKCFMPDGVHFDWVLISFVDNKGKGVRGIPVVVEHGRRGWHTTTDDVNFEYFLNNDCVVTHWRKIPIEPVRRREERKRIL